MEMSDLLLAALGIALGGDVGRTGPVAGRRAYQRSQMTKCSPFKHFKTSEEIIHVVVMMYVRFPLSLRNVEDLLHERGVDNFHETVRQGWHRFAPMFAAEIRKWRAEGMGSSRWRWSLADVSTKVAVLTSASASMEINN